MKFLLVSLFLAAILGAAEFRAATVPDYPEASDATTLRAETTEGDELTSSQKPTEGEKITTVQKPKASLSTKEPDTTTKGSKDDKNKPGAYCTSTGITYTPSDKVIGDYYVSIGESTKMYLKHCPDGLVFDTTVCVCNYPQQKHHKDETTTATSTKVTRPRPTTVKTSTEQDTTTRTSKPTIIAKKLDNSYCQASGVRYTPSKSVLGEYYVSIGTNVVNFLKKCPPGLVFDLSVCVCNWP